MPVEIGAQAANFADPTSLLSDCHRRIEMFLNVLQKIAKSADRRLADEASQALNTALRFFREAAPKHTADEEESLFPRLRQIEDSNLAALFSRLEPLEEDHRRVALLHARVDVLGQQWLTKGSLTSPQVEGFRALVAELSATYSKHIQVEDSVVFPLASKLLSSKEKVSIGKEMASRRNISSALHY